MMSVSFEAELILERLHKSLLFDQIIIYGLFLPTKSHSHTLLSHKL